MNGAETTSAEKRQREREGAKSKAETCLLDENQQTYEPQIGNILIAEQ